MNRISLSSKHKTDVTVISNIFIDQYMPGANGSFVKVYLYLLRLLNYCGQGISISEIADRLEDTEKDIIRALNYWEKVNLITLRKDSSNEITDIILNDVTSDQDMIDVISVEQAEIAATLEEETTDVLKDVQNSMNTTPKEYIKNVNPKHILDKPTYTQAQIVELTNTDEIKWLLNIIEIYLERLLKPTDIQLILYFYESLGFSTELIMYLYEYCVSKNKKNASYIEAVAISWAEEGIDTVEKAEASAVMYNSNYNAVNKAFGLNRAPGTVERQFINKWLTKFGFSIEIIVEACNRTILMTQKPDFKYADRILDNWHKKQVRHLSDIETLDKEHAKNVAKPQPKAVTPKTAPNKFNAFPQRNYTNEDYSSMEQRLLNKK